MKKYTCILFFLLNVSFSFLLSSEIKLVWLIDRFGGYWEEDWIMELLSDIDLKILDDCKMEKFINNSIIVVSAGLDPVMYNSYFEKLDVLKYNYGVILIGDETYKASENFYNNAKFVFRNYWHKKFENKGNVISFPLGYKTGFWVNEVKSIPTASQRGYNWSFAGQVSGKPTRVAMIAQMKKIPGYYIHETFSWGDPNSLNTLDYRNVLLQSIFAPSPRGWWNLDSFRVWEALECGCIPIVERGPIDYFGRFLKNHPFLVVDSWDQAPDLINTLLADPEALEQHRLKCYFWWQDYKKQLKSQVFEIVNTTLGSANE